MTTNQLATLLEHARKDGVMRRLQGVDQRDASGAFILVMAVLFAAFVAAIAGIVQ